VKTRVRLRSRRKKWDNVREWETAPPFVVNPRGILVHLIRDGATHLRDGEPSHHSVTYWCGNCCCIDLDLVNEALVDDPPAGRMLCSFCEAKATAAGHRPADEIAGRHVHKGVVRAHRVCCPDLDCN
jgi:hypothetical protein